MGALRVYLALCVVAAHSNAIFPWVTHDGRQAVQIFFLISGFYMELILSQDKYKTRIEFYASRLLRIFVPYYSIVGLILVASIIGGLLFNDWISLTPYLSAPLERNGLAGILLTAATNVTVFFQDWIMFLEHDAGETLRFTADFHASAYPLYNYMMITPAWSIGVELAFYATIPFLHRLRTRTLVIIVALSLAARFLAYGLFGLARDPWDNRFFPFELALFIMGVLAFRAYAASPLKQKSWYLRTGKQYVLALIPLLLLVVFSAKAVNVLSGLIGRHPALFLSYAVWAVVIAVLFHLFSKSRIDRFVGELSYPIYLVHILMIYIMERVLPRLGIADAYLGEISAVASIAVSIVLLLAVIRPFDRLRYGYAARVARRASAPQASQPTDTPLPRHARP